jgi:two-component system CheB/CheR fusion protein
MTVRADPARLQQVLRNIIKNAIQFSTRGGRVRLRSLPLGPGRIAVEVSDSGSGIEASDLRRIFLPFEQVGRGSRGLGLGLAISRALVEAQGGTLTAASDGAGRGATFRVVLQETRDDAPSAIRAGAEIPPPAEPPAPRRVLLVEDHADTANALRELLQELSCEVVAAGTVRDALAAAEAGSFDLVLSDLGLPDGSGLDLMRRLRDGHGLSGIAVSGYGMQEDLRRSLEAGFVEHLVKPVTFERLADAVDRFFAYRSAAGVSA